MAFTIRPLIVWDWQQVKQVYQLGMDMVMRHTKPGR